MSNSVETDGSKCVKKGIYGSQEVANESNKSPNKTPDKITVSDVSDNIIIGNSSGFQYFFPADVRKFVENRNTLHDTFEYPRNGSDPGLVTIFNQETFDINEKKREGTRKDVDDLILTLGRLGFNISEEFVFHDLTRQEILDKVNSLSGGDHTTRNCLIVIFLTHGNEDDMLCAKDGHIQTKEIWQKFAACESLKGKPKLFIFQACKGDKRSKLPSSTANEFEQPKENDIKLISSEIFSSSLESDMILVYAAVEGNASFRDLKKGTWFIQELCRNFLAYGRRDDVLSLIIRTSKCVATYKHSEGNDVYKQMPAFITTLTKRFYLMKSKDRNTTLKIKSTHEKILGDLRNLRSRLESLSVHQTKAK